MKIRLAFSPNTHRLLLLLLAVFLLVQPASTLALSEAQRKAFDSGVYYFDTEVSTCANTYTASGQIPIAGENPERAFTYFINQGLSPEQAAGITGNFMLESGPSIDPTIVSRSGYRGIAQWDAVSRWPALVAWANTHNADDPLNNELLFETQLEYSWLEATDRGNIDGMKQQPDVALSAWYWGRYFEGAVIDGSSSEEPLTNVQALKERTDFANQVFGQYGGSAATGGNNSPTVIALDPGHGGAVPEYADSITGLKDRETTNSPEREDVLDVANRIKTSLETIGYSVVLLRTTADQVINKRARIDAAKASNAAMVVSIHTTNGAVNEVWPQRVGKYRENLGDSSSRVTFDKADIAAKSEQYATTIAEERATAEGHSVDTDLDQSTQTGSFGRDGLPAVGNISLVQLWSTDIPWVYNEIGQDGGTSISDGLKQKYADGIANGIKQAVPSTGGGQASSGCTNANGDVVATALSYAWPDYRARGTPGALDVKPEYAAAVEAAQADRRYVGGNSLPGIDCGGFVTTVMVDSGFEPRYNCDGKGCPSSDGTGTAGQLQWVRDNWTKIGEITSTSQLQPGDVAFHVKSDGSNDGHTFMWVGDQPGFEYPIASSSLEQRAPMAGAERSISSSSQKIEWYRKL